MKQELSN